MKLPSHATPNHEFWVLRATMELPSFRISIHITKNSHMPWLHPRICVLSISLCFDGDVVIDRSHHHHCQCFQQHGCYSGSIGIGINNTSQKGGGQLQSKGISYPWPCKWSLLGSPGEMGSNHWWCAGRWWNRSGSHDYHHDLSMDVCIASQDRRWQRLDQIRYWQQWQW